MTPQPKRSTRLFRSLLLLVFIVLATPVALISANDNNIHWNELGHNSRDPLYRNPGGAVPTNTPVTLRLRALNDDLTGATVRVWNDRPNQEAFYPMNKVASGVTFSGDPNTYEFWEATLPGSALPTVYWYRFIANDGSATAFYEDDNARLGGWGEVFGSSPDNSYQLTIYDPAFETPDWVKNAIIYQIFPDRFRDGDPTNNPGAGEFFYGAFDTIVRSNQTEWNARICDPRSRPGSTAVCADKYSQNFYGGDLQGIIDKLDYIDDLGVTAIYLNPIFESPSNHKYDTKDFLQIDDNFGDLALFQTLVSEAHSRGINIILDGVFNHSSSDSYYFDRYSRWDADGDPTTIGSNDGSGACESTASPYVDWYTFFEYTGGGSAPCSDNRDYPKWFGIFDSLPVYQHDHPEVRDYFIDDGVNSVGPYWMQWADGWRLDVAPEIDHGTINDPGDDYWEEFRAAVHAVNPDAYIVGEEWGNPTSWTIDNQWDATMNYQFAAAVLSFWRDTTFTDNDFNGGSSAGTLAPLSPEQVNERLLNLQERYAPEAFAAMMNLFNSHDTNRVLFLLDHNADGNNTALYNDPSYDWSDARQRYQGALLMQMTLPGAPTIYYGDEVGTVNPPAYDGSQWQDDPYNRVPYPWLDASGTPYYAHMQNGTEQSNSIEYVSLLTGIRNSHPALRTGSFDPLLTDDADGVYVYGRKLDNDSNAAIVVVNKSGTAKNVTVDVSGYLPAGTTLEDVLNGGTVNINASGELTVSAPARNGNILIHDGFSNRPEAVDDLAATPGQNAVELNWSAATDATSYDVYRSLLSGGGYQFLANTNSTSYTDSTAQNATIYYYVVVSKNDTTLLTSDYSNEVSATPQYDLSDAWYNLQWPPTINHVLSAVNPTENVYGHIYIGGVTDASSDPVPGIRAQVGYGPEADPPSSGSWTWFEMSPNPGYDFGQNNDEYQGTMLPTQAGTFKYTTRWSGDGGQTWYYTDMGGPPYDPANAGTLTVNAPTDAIPPAAPTNLEVTATTSASVSLAWDAHPDTDGDLYGFEIWREDTSNPGFSKIATVADPNATSYVDTTVAADGNYNYYIKAIDTSFNASDPSNTVNATAERRLVDVTFTVTVPDPSPGTVYIAGSFGDFDGSTYPSWDPAGIALSPVDATTWEVTLTILDGYSVEYKYTRGEWEKVEKGADGNFELSNRQLTVDYGTTGEQQVNNTVENWRDPFVVAHHPADGATGVSASTVISATWNQAMPTSLSNFSVTGPGGAVSGVLSYDSGSFTHTFTPDAPLDPGTYNVAVQGNSDVNSDPQRVASNWSFTVAGSAPELSLYMTAAGAAGGSVPYGKEDILHYDGSSWSLFFDGSNLGLTNAKHDINAIYIPNSGETAAYISFFQNKTKVPGLGQVFGHDVLYFDGSSLSLYFDGSAVGLTTTAEKIDALHILDGGVDLPGGGSCTAYLLISTLGTGKVPAAGGGQLSFQGEDILGFCATNTGATTAGFWHMVLDGSAEGMPKNSTDSISANEDGTVIYLTTKKAFNVDSASGSHSEVYRYDFSSEEFSGPFFSAAAAGLTQEVDGLHVEGDLP